MLRCMETVTEHLYDMGARFIPGPTADGLVPIMNLNGQWKIKDFFSISSQYVNSAPKMSMNK